MNSKMCFECPSMSLSLRSLGRWLALSLAVAAAPIVTSPARADDATVTIGVAPQYTTTHVYVDPADLDALVKCFLATLGGQSTKQVVATLTPTPSSTTTQLLQTPVGTVSLFGFKTPVPWPFGRERSGALVTGIEEAMTQAKAAGADVVVAPFDDPIGKDMVVEWPGGVFMQLYWHTVTPKYDAFSKVPEDRVYVSPVRVDDFVKSYIRFSKGSLVSDDAAAPGKELGQPGKTYRRIRIESVFGKMVIAVTDGHLSFPYGREKTGYEVSNLGATIARATANGATVLAGPYRSSERDAAIVEFPGGYIAEIHSVAN